MKYEALYTATLGAVPAMLVAYVLETRLIGKETTVSKRQLRAAPRHIRFTVRLVSMLGVFVLIGSGVALYFASISLIMAKDAVGSPYTVGAGLLVVSISLLGVLANDLVNAFPIVDDDAE